MAGSSDEGTPDLTDAFSAIADGTRLRILVALAEAWRETWPDGLRYNELMDRVGVTDSGKFNYHLQQLRPEFVAKREGTYRVALPGLRVYQMLVAGYVEPDGSAREVDPGADCPRCGDALGAEVTEWDTLVVSCPGCAMRTVQAEMLPRCVDSHGDDDALRAADLLRRTRMFLFSRGVCPYCSGVATTAVHDGSSAVLTHEGGDLDLAYVFDCGDCGWFDASTAGGVLYTHPAVVTLFAEQGADVYDHRTWELAWACTDDHTTIAARDPWRVEVEVAFRGQSRVVTLDGDASVLDVETGTP